MERSVKSYSQHGKRFTKGIQYYRILDFARTDQFGKIWSEDSHFIPDPRTFAEVTKLSENIRKPWLKATLKKIHNLINNQTFLIEAPNDGEPVTPCMDDYKANVKYDGSLDKLKLRIVVIGY